MPDEPDRQSGLPPYPGSTQPPAPGSSPPPYPGGPERPPDTWYQPPSQQGPGGYYYPPESPPPGPFGAPGRPPGYPAPAPFASYWARVGGFVLDSILVTLVSLLYLLPSHALRIVNTHNANGTTTPHVHYSDFGALVVPFLLGALYASLMIGLRGQTLGMMAVRVRAIDGTSGQLIGFWRALGRDLFMRFLQIPLFYFLPALVDFLFPLWDARRQTLHDKVTRTVVVRA